LPNALQVHEKSGIFVTLTGRPGSPRHAQDGHCPAV